MTAVNPKQADPSRHVRADNLSFIRQRMFEERPYVAVDGHWHAEYCCVTMCPHDSQHVDTGCCIPEHWRTYCWWEPWPSPFREDEP